MPDKLPSKTGPTCYAAGIDIGSATAKTVIMDRDGVIKGQNILSQGILLLDAGNLSFKQACAAANINEKDIKYVVATGYGRSTVKFANTQITEISCHARGVYSLFPDCRTVIDIGGQDSKVISLDSKGQITDFAMNDKCAAGTGRWLETMARALNIDISNIGELALKAKQSVNVNNTCTVFAESEVISYITAGYAIEDVLLGVHRAIAERVVNTLARRVGIIEKVVLTGGVAKNIAAQKEIGRATGFSILVPPEPQLTGALGAAHIALDHLLQ